jgi:hypothetical protein
MSSSFSYEYDENRQVRDLEKRLCLFLIHYLSHQLAFIMILKTWTVSQKHMFKKELSEAPL